MARRVCERLGLLEWGPVKKVLGMLDQAVEAEEQMGWRMLGLHIVLSAICWALLFAVAYMFLHTIGLKLAYHEVVLGDVRAVGDGVAPGGRRWYLRSS